MTDPFSFDSATPRYGLPLLFTGQSQKEIFVNEAHALTDAILHCAVEEAAAAPPPSPPDGSNWLVIAPASGAWTGREGCIACRQAGNWLFVEPRDGLRVLDRTTGEDMLYLGAWRTAENIWEPSGGSNVDSEARAAIHTIIAAMKLKGILPDPT